MTRAFVIGDIHGCYDELQELIKNAGINDDDLIISVGDIIDRGNKSKEVYEYFKSRINSVVLVGNHERKHQNNILSYAQEIVKLQFKDEYPEFLEWIHTLGYYYETDEAIVVHAAFEHDKNLYQQREDILSGSTSGERYLEKKYSVNTYWIDYYNGEKPIIYGHHVVGDIPKIKNNTYGIDTGACHGGFLTAIELPGFVVHRVKSKKDYWKEDQKEWQIPVLKSKKWEETDFLTIKKQLEKLSYIEEEDVRSLLKQIEKWSNDLENLFTEIYSSINKISAGILEHYPENFSIEANKYEFSRFLFMSKSNKLTLEELKKVIDTPNKVIEIAKTLNIDVRDSIF